MATKTYDLTLTRDGQATQVPTRTRTFDLGDTVMVRDLFLDAVSRDTPEGTDLDGYALEIREHGTAEVATTWRADTMLGTSVAA